MRKCITLAFIAIAALTGTASAQETVSFTIEVTGKTCTEQKQCLDGLTEDVKARIREAETEKSRQTAAIGELKGQVEVAEAKKKTLEDDKAKLEGAEKDAREGSALHAAYKKAEEAYKDAVRNAVPAEAEAKAQDDFFMARNAYEKAKEKATELRGQLKERYGLEGDDIAASFDKKISEYTLAIGTLRKQIQEAEAALIQRDLHLSALREREDRIGDALERVLTEEGLEIGRKQVTLLETLVINTEATRTGMDALGKVTVAGFNNVTESVGEVKTSVDAVNASVQALHKQNLLLIEQIGGIKAKDETTAADIAELVRLAKAYVEKDPADAARQAEAAEALRSAQKKLEAAQAAAARPAAPAASTARPVAQPQPAGVQCYTNQYGQRYCPQVRTAPQAYYGGWYHGN